MNTDTISDINAAIGRSISHTEIVRVTVPDEKEALSYLDECGRITELDHARENDGSLDVWGTRQGDDFRLRIITETPTPQPEQEQQETAAPAARSEAAVEAAFQSAEKLIETSEDISSALIWLTSSTEDASRRIRGAIECLRKCQPARKAANEAFMAATA